VVFAIFVGGVTGAAVGPIVGAIIKKGVGAIVGGIVGPLWGLFCSSSSCISPMVSNPIDYGPFYWFTATKACRVALSQTGAYLSQVSFRLGSLTLHLLN